MMKNYISKLLLVVTLTFCFTFVSIAQSKRLNSKLIEPTAKESIKQIMLNGNLLLTSYPSCKSYASAEEKTIRDYFASFLSFQSMPDSAYILDFKFTQEKAKNGEVIWVCDLVWRIKDEQDTSTDGFRFKMSNSQRKLLPESLMCIGTG